MNKKIILIGIAILAVAAVTHAAWYSYDRHEKLVQAQMCNDTLTNPPKPTIVTGPDGNPAPLYSLNGCVTIVVPPSLWDLLRGHIVFENVPQRMKVNPYSFTDILLGRYTFGPTAVGCNQSATTTDCSDIAAIVAQKQAMAGPTITPGADEAPPPPTLGIQDPIDQDIVGKEMVLGTNSWWGYVDGKLTTVTGTAYRNNPSQGALFIWEPDGGIESSRTYLAPTATGPLKIVSEANGILTVQSVADTYEVYDINTDIRTYVTTKGGTTYTFDVASRTFQQ